MEVAESVMVAESVRVVVNLIILPRFLTGCCRTHMTDDTRILDRLRHGVNSEIRDRFRDRISDGIRDRIRDMIIKDRIRDREIDVETAE